MMQLSRDPAFFLYAVALPSRQQAGGPRAEPISVSTGTPVPKPDDCPILYAEFSLPERLFSARECLT